MRTDLAAIVRDHGGSPALTPVTIIDPRPGEVLVRVLATGVCHTDLAGIDGDARYPLPAVFGHEGAGIVEAVGEGVTGRRPGDQVVLSFASCGGCDACVEGHPAYCGRFAALNQRPESDVMAVTGTGEAVHTGWMRQSSWATRVIAHESNTTVVPHDVPAAVAAPLGCAVLTGVGTVLNVLAPRRGDDILILGAGAVGLSAVMAAKASGCRSILVSDPIEARRMLALELGATVAVTPGQVDAVLADRGAVRLALDTVGTQDAIDTALAALAPRGTCATIALRPGSNRLTIAQSRLLWGRTVTGVIEGDAVLARDIPRLVAMWRAGRLPVEKLVTVYDFDDVARAIEDTRSGAVVKAVLVRDGRADEPAPQSDGVIETLRRRSATDDETASLWRTLPPVDPGELRGLWRGWALTRDHRAERMLARLQWYGKRFRSDEDVDPLVCRGSDGVLIADEEFARGGASLHRLERDGVLTAAMVYDALPIIDSFTRLTPDAVLGVMAGRDVQDAGRDFYFVLERDPQP